MNKSQNDFDNLIQEDDKPRFNVLTVRMIFMNLEL